MPPSNACCTRAADLLFSSAAVSPAGACFSAPVDFFSAVDFLAPVCCVGPSNAAAGQRERRHGYQDRQNPQKVPHSPRPIP